MPQLGSGGMFHAIYNGCADKKAVRLRLLMIGQKLVGPLSQFSLPRTGFVQESTPFLGREL